MTAANANRAPAPLADEAVERLHGAVTGFSAEGLTWASGYLAGLAAAAGGAAAEPAASPAGEADAGLTLAILYGSQTGNGRRLAEALAESAATRGIAHRLIDMADYRERDLKRERLAVFIVSTHGEGDPPDDAEALHEFLSAERAPRLEQLSYGVLALGDSSYAQFCQTGRDFDARLEALGAKRIQALVECDLDYETPAAEWSGAVLEGAAELIAESVPATTAVGSSVRPILRAVPTPAYGPDRPFAAEVLANQKITGRDSTKDVRHIALSLEDSGIVYEPGDSLGVITRNPPALIEELIGTLALEPDSALAAGGTLAEALAERFEITGASVAFLERYAALEGAGALAEMLAPERRSELAAYLEARQVVDIVREHPVRVTADAFAGCLRPFKPRLYSIASSPLASPEEVHLTVANVEYQAFGRPHWGAASNHLSLRLEPGEPLGVYVEPNPRFRLPADDDAPVIMIGPGTGVAPFRAFLEQREAAGAKGRNWLFFGDRSLRDDFLYQLDWARFRKRGVLDRMDVAFSRDQADKIYVQHRMLECANELYAWLEQGAHVYVCGDAAAMAPDVHAALVEVAARAGGLDAEAAEDYVKRLRRDGRYRRDVY